MKKLLISAFIILLIGIISGILYLRYFLPSIPLQDISVETTQRRIERGKYLANHVAVCIDCHATRDWSKFSGPIVSGTEGKGGERFGKDMGFPGNYYSQNITPYNLEDWTDAEIYRAIVSGVGKENNALFPVMPYPLYKNMDKEDILSIIAYIRTLDPIRFDVPKSKSEFPFSLIINTIPKEPMHESIPKKGTNAYGEYMINTGACIECHTPVEKGQIIKEKAYSGGREFPLVEGGTVISTNITPHMKTGIGAWTLGNFINRFISYNLETYTPQAVNKGEYNSIMPWTMYAGMDSADLAAIYKYLQTVQPIENKVVRFKPEKK